MGLHTAPGLTPSVATVTVPTFVGNEMRGGIAIDSHDPARLFGPAEVRLLQTVAASMGLALENARLFSQTRDALAQQAASAKVLETISQSMDDTAPVFAAILDCCEQLIPDFDAVFVDVVDDRQMVQLGDMRFARVRGAAPGDEGQAARKAQLRAIVEGDYPYPLAGSDLEIAVQRGCPNEYADVLEQPDVLPMIRAVARKFGHSYSAIEVPLVHEGQPLGQIRVARRRLGGFVEKERALLRSFADQAVVAIQNTRMFNDTREALE